MGFGAGGTEALGASICCATVSPLKVIGDPAAISVAFREFRFGTEGFWPARPPPAFGEPTGGACS